MMEGHTPDRPIGKVKCSVTDLRSRKARQSRSLKNKNDGSSLHLVNLWFVVERFVGMRGDRGNGHGFGDDLFLEIIDSGFQLGVLSFEGFEGEIVDDDVR